MCHRTRGLLIRYADTHTFLDNLKVQSRISRYRNVLEKDRKASNDQKRSQRLGYQRGVGGPGPLQFCVSTAMEASGTCHFFRASTKDSPPYLLFPGGGRHFLPISYWSKRKWGGASFRKKSIIMFSFFLFQRSILFTVRFLCFLATRKVEDL